MWEAVTVGDERPEHERAREREEKDDFGNNLNEPDRRGQHTNFPVILW